MQNETQNTPQWTEAMLKARRRRAILMALALGGLVVMFFLVTVVRLGANIAQGGG